MKVQALQLTRMTRAMAVVFPAGATGYFAWGEYPVGLGVSVLIAYFWASASSRRDAGLVAFVYYLAVARGLPKGIAVFFGTQASMLSGVVFWSLASALLALPWAVFWPKGGDGYAWRLATILAIVSLPPIGIIGWGNPLTAAGALFPHTGWLGLFAAYVLMLLFCRMARLRTGVLGVCVVQALLLLYGSGHSAPENNAAKGIDTTLPGSGYGEYSGAQSYFNNLKLISLVRAEAEGNVSTILLPESVAGLWLDATYDLWRNRQLFPERVFFGATEILPGGDYNNVLVAVTTDDRSPIVYRQRVPVPIGMWHPWRQDSAIANWRAPGGFVFDEVRYGVLVCYEQLLVWPVLQTYAERPALVLAPANAWWSQDTSIPAIQQSVVAAWSRLFDVPAVTAFNYY